MTSANILQPQDFYAVDFWRCTGTSVDAHGLHRYAGNRVSWSPAAKFGTKTLNAQQISDKTGDLGVSIDGSAQKESARMSFH